MPHISSELVGELSVESFKFSKYVSLCLSLDLCLYAYYLKPRVMLESLILIC